MPGPLVIIGNPNAVFIQSMARYWTERGIEVAIVTANHWHGPAFNEDGVRVIAAEGTMSADASAVVELMLPTMATLERELHAARPERVARAMSSWGPDAEAPSLLPPLVDAIAIAKAVKALDPVAVFGNEAFAYGLATAMCRDVRRTLFAWGGDVLQFCETSDAAASLMATVLKQAHYVIAGSRTVQQHIIDRFAIPEARTVLFSMGVNRAMFAPAAPHDSVRIFQKFGIPPGAEVVLNVRRFRPHWGSEVAFDALIALARRRPTVCVVTLGGLGTEAAMASARERAHAAGVGSRFIGIDGDAPIEAVAELMSIAHVHLSLTQQDEPLSLSVLQAAASGSVGVISDHATYREAIQQGLSGVLVDPTSATQVEQAVERLLSDAPMRTAMRLAGIQFISEHYDEASHMDRLLRIIVGRQALQNLARDPVPAR